MDIRRVDQSYAAPPGILAPGTGKKKSVEPPITDRVEIGASPAPESTTPKKWTIMSYSAADNNLLDFMDHDANEMERVGSNRNMNLLLLHDRGGEDCNMYYLERDNNIARIESPVLKKMGNTDMANPQTLTDFITHCMEKYPAEHYCLIIGDHGDGWKGAVSDDTSGTWMTLPTIRKGIEDAEKKL